MVNQLLTTLEIKAIHDREFEGHAAIFGNVDLGGDVVMPGAFRRSLARHRKAGTWPPMFYMHNPELVPGVWKKIAEDDTGLAVVGELVDTQLGNEVRTLLQKKAVRGLSIGYKVVDLGFDGDGNRLLKEIDLWESSIVSMALNPLARVQAVKARLSSEGEYVPTERELELILRDARCSRKVAQTMIARLFDPGLGGIPSVSRRDSGQIEEEDEFRELLSAIGEGTAFLVREAFRRK